MAIVNTPWNKYEVALLIDACNKVSDFVITRKEAVSQLSKRLRYAVYRNGIPLSDTYRNENGIALQMSSMDYCLTSGKKGLPNHSSLFEEISKLYKSDFSAFALLLANARLRYPVVEESNISDITDVNESAFKYRRIENHHIELKERKETIKVDLESKSPKLEGNDSIQLNQDKVSFSKEILNKIINHLKNVKAINGHNSCSVNDLFNLFIKEMRAIHVYSPTTLKNQLKLIYPNWQFFCTDIILNSIDFDSEIEKDVINKSVNTISSDINNKILSTLTRNFKNGYRLDSNIERKKFQRIYKEEHSEECPVDILWLDSAISNLGLEYGKKVYLPDLMLDHSLRKEIESYITEMFESGLQYINYASITQHFHDKLLDSQITTDELLKSYLNYYFPKWTYKKDFLCVNRNVEPDVEAEVFQYVKEQGCPVSESAVVKALSHLPKDKIHQVFNFSSDTLIATSRSNERFHIDNFVISKKEIDKLSLAIYNTISEEEYTTWADLCGFIHLNQESLFTQNALISELGVRNALRVLLKSRFKFNNNIICFPNKEVSVEKIVGHYIKNNELFTLDTITTLTSEFGTGIYWEEIVKYAVRIDIQNFVSKDKVKFSVDTIDKLLGDFCTQEYIPIESVNLFIEFPDCGFQWNLFLLENYVTCYSKKFRMVHKSFQRTCVKGAIVRKKSKIKTLSDIVLDQLIKAPKMYNSDEILEILKEDGYIARSRFGDINQIIEQAKLIRENSI